MQRRRRFANYGLEVRRIRLVMEQGRWLKLCEAADRRNLSIAAQIEQWIIDGLYAEQQRYPD